MPDPSDAELDQLLDLQRTDHRVRKAEHALNALPEQQAVAAAETRAAELTAVVSGLTAELTRTEAEATTLSRDIDTLTARRDAEQVRLYDGTVTNQREMSSVEAEIDSTTHRIEEHEEDLLVVLERTEELEGRQAAAEAEAAAATEAVTAAEGALDAAAKALIVEIGEARAERDRQAAALPEDLLARYEQAATRGGGTGVGELDGLACSACRIEMSRVDVDDLYNGPNLTTCPQCRRLLVVR